MNSKKFILNYLEDFTNLVVPKETTIEKLTIVTDMLKDVHSTGRKAIIFGNGGSSAIASHFSVDITKNAGIRCVNFNEPDLITCFSNDYGFDRWIEKAVDFYGDEGDIIILISSSGRSKNMINGAKAARNAKFKSVITFSGFEKNNPLKQIGDINFWVDSKAYNLVENIHQFWLLLIVDLIIGKKEYSA